MQGGSDAWRPLQVSCINMRKAAGEMNRECLRLPHSAVPQNCRMALDIGGSLAKIAYIVTGKENEDENEAQVHLVTFDIDQLDSCLIFIKETMSSYNEIRHYAIKATGVGCHKFKEKITDTLRVGFTMDDLEMEHLASGMRVLWQFMDKEDLVYPSSNTSGLSFRTSLTESGMAPFLLVNLGSAMTCVKVNADGQMSGIVGASTFAGLSFLGLGGLLTSAKNFPDLLKLAEDGDRNNVDLLVRDTAGDSVNYNKTDPDMMVSSFGKAAKYKGSSVKRGFQESDLASSLLYAVTDNLATQSYYIAQSQQLKRICFCGTYLSGNSTIMHMLKNKHDLMGGYLKYEVKSLFMRHEGYLGVLGLLFDDRIPPTTNGDHHHS